MREISAPPHRSDYPTVLKHRPAVPPSACSACAVVEVGPIYIEGATTNDKLVVEVIEVNPNYEFAASRVNPAFGGLATDVRMRLLNDPIPARRYVWRLDHERMTGTTELPGSEMGSIEIELEPMLGRVAVAPRGEEAFGGLWPGDFGGNLDAPEVRPGSR